MTTGRINQVAFLFDTDDTILLIHARKSIIVSVVVICSVLQPTRWVVSNRIPYHTEPFPHPQARTRGMGQSSLYVQWKNGHMIPLSCHSLLHPYNMDEKRQISQQQQPLQWHK